MKLDRKAITVCACLASVSILGIVGALAAGKTTSNTYHLECHDGSFAANHLDVIESNGALHFRAKTRELSQLRALLIPQTMPDWGRGEIAFRLVTKDCQRTNRAPQLVNCHHEGPIEVALQYDGAGGATQYKRLTVSGLQARTTRITELSADGSIVDSEDFEVRVQRRPTETVTIHQVFPLEFGGFCKAVPKETTSPPSTARS